LARKNRGTALYTLHHVIDLDWMKEAYRLTRKDGAPGIDGVTAADYEAKLEDNLRDLLDRIKSGRYHAPPVRRAYIPKADGSQRMLGIPTFEDKVAQRVVTMVLEAVYEQEFLPCSYGFRPGRSAHHALRNLRQAIWSKRLHWVLDIDIRKYFDSIPHNHLRAFLDQRVADGVIRRMIDKWLKAGAVENGLLHRTTEGSPQGGVISPCLSNVFLHYVLDEWFETEVRPRLSGDCTLARYADDAVMAFANIDDAQRVMAVLGRRLGRFGLTLHPDKTRLVDFRPKQTGSARHPNTEGTSFDFLGLTHVWGRSRQGRNMVRQVTAKSRWLLLGSGVVTGPSRNQAGDEGAEQGFAASARIVHELEEAEVERQLVLRHAPVRAQPGTQQRPEAFHRVDVDLAKPVSVLVAGILAVCVADRFVPVAPG